jgi:hypothetical protein
VALCPGLGRRDPRCNQHCCSQCHMIVAVQTFDALAVHGNGEALLPLDTQSPLPSLRCPEARRVGLTAPPSAPTSGGSSPPPLTDGTAVGCRGGHGSFKFAADSSLEQSRFELPVPLSRNGLAGLPERSACGVIIRRCSRETVITPRSGIPLLRSGSERSGSMTLTGILYGGSGANFRTGTPPHPAVHQM